MLGVARVAAASMAVVLMAQPFAALTKRTGSPSKITVIRAGYLIDGRGGPPVANAVILIDGERIVAAGPAFPSPVVRKSSTCPRRPCSLA